MVEIYCAQLSVFWARTLVKNLINLSTVVHYLDNRFLCSVKSSVIY